MNIFLDKPVVAQGKEVIYCDQRCNFTIESNPIAEFVSLENEGDIYEYLQYSWWLLACS